MIDRKIALRCLTALGACAALLCTYTRVAYAVNNEANGPRAGFSARGLEDVDSVVTRALRGGAAPGAALVVGRSGQIVRLRGYGSIDWTFGSPAVTDSTIYDIASLTKTIGTTTAALQLVREGKLGLDAPVSKYIRSWPKKGRYGRIQIRHLLFHTSGLPAGTALWTKKGDRDARLKFLSSLRVYSEPGKVREYSDVGLILLGEIIEEIEDKRLDEVVRERVALPLGLRDTDFNPLRRTAYRSPFDLDRIAPTENESWKRGFLHGIVHDLNAYALDGVAGHAGMFSSARDMAVIGNAMLNAALGRPNQLFPGTWFRDLLASERSHGRPLGWDVPSGPNPSAGQHFSGASFGHTGFTGTSIWIDPDKELFVVLLTNRVNPTAANNRHVALRRDLHDAVQEAILGPPLFAYADSTAIRANIVLDIFEDPRRAAGEGARQLLMLLPLIGGGIVSVGARRTRRFSRGPRRGSRGPRGF